MENKEIVFEEVENYEVKMTTGEAFYFGAGIIIGGIIVT